MARKITPAIGRERADSADLNGAAGKICETAQRVCCQRKAARIETYRKDRHGRVLVIRIVLR